MGVHQARAFQGSLSPWVGALLGPPTSLPALPQPCPMFIYAQFLLGFCFCFFLHTN